MKNILKNALAKILVLVMILGVAPVGVLAYDHDECPNAAYTRDYYCDCENHGECGCGRSLRPVVCDVVPQNSNYRSLNMTPEQSSNMRFTWQSPSSYGSIQYRALGSSAWTSVAADSSRPMPSGISGNWNVHQVRIRNLLADTVYEYRIRWTGGESSIKNFRTGGNNAFSFVAVSDPQIATSAEGQAWANTMAVVATAFPDVRFVLSMGDQVSSSANRTFENAQRNFNLLLAPTEFHRLPFAPVVGNHDSVPTTGSGVNVNPQLWHYNFNTPVNASHVRHFSIPHADAPNPQTQFDYYFRYGNVLVIMLSAYCNDTHGGTGGGTRGTQARAEISGARRTWFRNTLNENTDAEWRIVAFHTPSYSANRDPLTTTSVQAMRQNWLPIFEAYNIDAAFSGHDHIYSRSHHMRGGTPRLSQTWESQPNNAVRIPRGGTGGSSGTGVTYFAFGSPSGHEARQPDFMPRSYLARYHQANLREFSVVSVTPFTFSVATYMINGTGIAGNTITMTDIYTIVRPTRPNGTYIPQFEQAPRPVLPMQCDFCGQEPCVCPPAVYDMQRDPNWSEIFSVTAHPIMRGSNLAETNRIRVDAPSRELRFVNRTGTSQGMRIRAEALLAAMTNANDRIQIEYFGRLNGSGSSQIRIEGVTGEVWTSPTGAGNIFSQTLSLTRTQIENAVNIGNGDITLGAVPSSAELTITGIRITVTQGEPVQPFPVTIQNGGAGASATPNPARQGQNVRLNAGTPPAGMIFGNWTTATSGVNMKILASFHIINRFFYALFSSA
jgi:hypothetical protein